LYCVLNSESPLREVPLYTIVDAQIWTQTYADVRNACVKAHTNYECKCMQT